MKKLIDIARLAGLEILKIYGKEDFGIELKSDDSPVTIADKAANDFVCGAHQTVCTPVAFY